MEPVNTTRRVSDGSGTTMLLFIVNEQVLGRLKPWIIRKTGSFYYPWLEPKRESEARFIRPIIMTQSFLAY